MVSSPWGSWHPGKGATSVGAPLWGWEHLYGHIYGDGNTSIGMETPVGTPLWGWGQLWGHLWGHLRCLGPRIASLSPNLSSPPAICPAATLLSRLSHPFPESPLQPCSALLGGPLTQPSPVAVSGPLPLCPQSPGGPLPVSPMGFGGAAILSASCGPPAPMCVSPQPCPQACSS